MTCSERKVSEVGVPAIPHPDGPAIPCASASPPRDSPLTPASRHTGDSGASPRISQDQLVKEGYLVRVYVPFGKEWFGYSTRRLKENPKMASLILKAIFIRK